MKSIAIIIWLLLGACVVSSAQVEFAAADYFPADLEFRELQKMLPEESFEDPALLSKVEDGRLIQDVGFSRYARRTYSVEGSAELVIEILTLQDFRAAYSLMTLLSTGPIRTEAPGDLHSSLPGSIRFAQGRQWVRLHGTGVSEDLIRRVAISISNRIGVPQAHVPSLVARLPKSGFDASSLRYFPSLASLKSYLGESAAKSMNLVSDAEIARAQYMVDGRPATLFLFNFPTGQVAEDYFNSVDAIAAPSLKSEASYAKQVGPLVAVLRGPLDAAAANRLLGTLRYSYSIRWIFEKKNQSRMLWGIPTAILGTVVKSLFFVALLGVLSVLAGAVFAFLRFSFRNRRIKNALDSEEESDFIKLRLR
jgi:hypothetical protein